MEKNPDTRADASVVQLVDALVQAAVFSRASDIHLEPNADALRVRFRIDGVLYDQKPIEKDFACQVASRLKVLGNMNIAEKRIPQDGKFNSTINGQFVDFRVSTFPSLFGEKVVVRILDRGVHTMQLEQLGLSPDMCARFNELIEQPNGFFLATGPTGSGKTTSLYAALAKLNSPDKNIVTLEDPVEYNLDGITQGRINPDAGFTFEKGIRALLRQDPDVLMIGEIRDKQTAAVAIEAALTGHVVLSTLHTNDAPSAIMRLMDMGIEPFLINASLSGVLAQRLVRAICSGCKQEKKPTEQELQLMKKFKLEDAKLFHGVGCQGCNKLGYKGRTGIFELLTVTAPLRSLIIKQPIFDDVYACCLSNGMTTLAHDGADKVRRGIITIEELARTIV